MDNSTEQKVRVKSDVLAEKAQQNYATRSLIKAAKPYYRTRGNYKRKSLNIVSLME